MGKNKNKNKKSRPEEQSEKQEAPRAESASEGEAEIETEANSPMDTVQKSPSIAPYEHETSETAANAPDLGPESSQSPTTKAAETNEPVSHTITVSEEGMNRPSVQSPDSIFTTNESFVSARSGEQPEDESPPGTAPSDALDVPEDANSGHRSPATEVLDDTLIGPDDGEQQSSPAETRDDTLVAPDDGGQAKEHAGHKDDPDSIPLAWNDHHGAEPSTTPQEPAPEERQPEEHDESQPRQDEGSGGDVEAVTNMEEKELETRERQELDEGQEKWLAVVAESPPFDKSQIDDVQREAGQLTLEYYRRKEQQKYKQGLDAVEGKGEQAGEDETGLEQASDWIKQQQQEEDEDEEAEGGPARERTQVVNLEQKLELERRKVRELRLELEKLRESPDMSPEKRSKFSPGAGGEGSENHGRARSILNRKSYLLGHDTQIFSTVLAIANYIDGIGYKPIKEVRDHFGEFRDYVSDRARILEEILEGDEPLATMQDFDGRWPPPPPGDSSPWGDQLELRLAAVRAATYVKYGKDSPHFDYAVMQFEQQMSSLRSGLGDDFDDPVVLQMEDILSSATTDK